MLFFIVLFGVFDQVFEDVGLEIYIRKIQYILTFKSVIILTKIIRITNKRISTTLKSLFIRSLIVLSFDESNCDPI